MKAIRFVEEFRDEVVTPVWSELDFAVAKSLAAEQVNHVAKRRCLWRKIFEFETHLLLKKR